MLPPNSFTLFSFPQNELGLWRAFGLFGFPQSELCYMLLINPTDDLYVLVILIKFVASYKGEISSFKVGTMRLQVWFQTDIGFHRKNNQDRFLIDHKHHLYTLADGMGGHSGGDTAASIAVQTVRDVVVSSYNQSAGVDPKELITKIFNIATQKIFKMSQEQQKLKGMGTTLVVAIYRDEKLYIGHVGDSRAYLLSKASCGTSGMWQITDDHSLINERIKAGLLKEKDRCNFYP